MSALRYRVWRWWVTHRYGPLHGPWPARDITPLDRDLVTLLDGFRG